MLTCLYGWFERSLPFIRTSILLCWQVARSLMQVVSCFGWPSQEVGTTDAAATACADQVADDSRVCLSVLCFPSQVLFGAVC